MSSASRAAELRALADQIEVTDELGIEAAAAKQAYAEALQSSDADVIAEARQKHREASQALSEARSSTRTGLIVGDSAPGSATVQVGTIAGKVG
jgi:cellobiose-specific phosphotransferase system component IIA